MFPDEFWGNGWNRRSGHWRDMSIVAFSAVFYMGVIC
jgi:hypothetical protein